MSDTKPQYRKMSKSAMKLTREQEEAQRARAAAGPDLTLCKHFAPGTRVTSGDVSYEVIEADERRLRLTLRADDGTTRTVLRPGA